MESFVPMVQVQIVTYNSENHLAECISSVLSQTYHRLRILIIDNASTDASRDISSQFVPSVHVMSLPRNLGYTGAHNVGFRHAFEQGAQYVLTLNPDARLSPDYVANLVKAISEDPRCGGVSGKLLRTSSGENGEAIDSAGLRMEKFLHVRDRGSGRPDGPEFDEPSSVWGVCGAAAMYRMDVLLDLSPDAAAFDETFFLYKEDVDLSWRANRQSWHFLYCPTAVAYHHRGWAKGEQISPIAAAHSFANQIALLIRHVPRLSWRVVASLGIESVRLMLLAVRRPAVAGLSVRLIVQHWRHHWAMRAQLRSQDSVKASILDDLCRSRHV